MEAVTGNINKIAILRANALGDFIVTLPAIQAIRTAYPHAEICLLAAPWHKEFLIPGRTPVNRVIVIPEFKGIRGGLNENKAEQERFFALMQNENFDIALHFQGQGIQANPFLKRLNARFTAGLSVPEAEPLDRSVTFYEYQNETAKYLEVAGLIGAEKASLTPELKILQQDHKEADEKVIKNISSSYVVLHSTAADKRREWPADKFAELGKYFSGKNYSIVFTGLENEKEYIQSIIEKMAVPAYNAAGQLSLGGLASLLSRSELVISGDTGPLHLALAVGAKTIGIYWAPNFTLWAPLTRSVHRPVISWELPCPNCGIIPNTPFPFMPLDKCKHEVSFVRNVPVAEVIEEAEILLSLNKSVQKQQTLVA